MELSETFWTSFYGFGGGFILAVIALMYKSKCDQVKICFGCLEIHRDVEVELQEDMKRIETFEDAKESDV
jgi:hypothetical protein